MKRQCQDMLWETCVEGEEHDALKRKSSSIMALSDRISDASVPCFSSAAEPRESTISIALEDLSAGQHLIPKRTHRVPGWLFIRYALLRILGLGLLNKLHHGLFLDSHATTKCRLQF